MRTDLLLTPALCALLLAPAIASAGELSVVSTEPASHSLAAPADAPIVVRFDRPVRRASFVARRSFWAFGRSSGPVLGRFEFSDSDRSVALRPNRPLFAGESVLVVLSTELEAADGSPLRAGGHSFQFWTAAAPASLDFRQTGRLELRDEPGQTTRAYGGLATDLDDDGYPDLAIVNEDSADLRVFLGNPLVPGTFGPMLRPPAPLGGRASPSEPSDFDRDGIADLCISNFGSNQVSILLGRGDGTFRPQQLVPVGVAPHGLAVLDANGDGATDIVTSNALGDDLSLLLNDGAGRFALASSFDSGGSGEWALASGDMNGDGRLDLVTGTSTSREIRVLLGQGDGSFAPGGSRFSGGHVWQLALGDVDGDGAADVAAVHYGQAQAALHLGDGAGGLGAAVLHPVADNPLATDLGDLDGDGDLDWITSSITGRQWHLFRNQGDGSFVREQDFLAEVAASCAILADLDRDGDVDMALIDELGDLVLVMQNGGRAGARPLTEAIGVPETLAGDQRNPAVCLRPAGDALVAWSDAGSGQGADVLARRLDASGTLLSAVLPVDTGGLADRQRVALACTGDGGFTVAWDAVDGASEHVWLRAFAPDGQPRSAPVDLGPGAYPALAASPAGEVLALWETPGLEGDPLDLRMRRFDATGLPLGPASGIGSADAGLQGEPSAAFDASGRLAVVWQSQPPGGDWDVTLRLFDASGTPAAAEQPVPASAAGDQVLPRVARAPDGRLVVAWQGPSGDGSGQAVRVRFLDRHGQHLTGELDAPAQTGGDPGLPAVAASALGDFLVAWEASSLQAPAGRGLAARLFDRDGAAQGDELSLRDTPFEQQRPAAAMASDGRFVLVWQSPDRDGSGLGVFARWFEPARPGRGLLLPALAPWTAGLAGLAGAALLRRFRRRTSRSRNLSRAW